MSRSKGGLILRLAKTFMFLQNPHTVGELAKEIGIEMRGASFYIPMLRQAGYPVLSRKRSVSGSGQNPLEYWINYKGSIVMEGLRIFARLRGM